MTPAPRFHALLALGAALLVAAAPAQWETIVPGFEYQKFTLPGPVEAFVGRMALDDVSARAIDSMIAQGQFHKTGLVNGGREVVSQMAARHDETIGFYQQVWGNRNDVVFAINGDYWERESYPSGPFTGRPESGQVHGGWFCRRFDEFSGGSGYFYTVFGAPFLGGDVVNGGNAARQTVHFSDSTTANLTGVNVARGGDSLILYTPQWDSSTHTDDTGVEVVLRVDRPALPLPNGTSAHSCTGTVIALRDGQGNAPIAYNGAVLSATGSPANTLRNRVTVGDVVRLRMTVRDYGFAGRTPPHPEQDWTKAYGACGVDREIVIAGAVTNLPSPDTTRDPRTAVCFNAAHAFFLVVDGRRGGSAGMSFGELAVFMINSLAATTGASLDGGGSSALWVQGRGIVNVPSDGSERATTNGLMMVNVLPRVLSTAFGVSDEIHTDAPAMLRCGPGTNWDALADVSAGQVVTLDSDPLRGVLATGQHWWPVQIGASTGWLPESALATVQHTHGLLLH